MNVDDLIGMILSLDARDKEHIKVALDVDATKSVDALSILDLLMGQNDANAATIRGYFKALLTKLWEEGEGFSGRCPFGNSGWERELYFPLVKAGRVSGQIEKYETYGGDNLEGLERIDDKDAADQMIFDAINQL